MSAALPPNRAVLAAIADQRARNWPDFHPEDYCHRCGGRNVASWCVESDRFNAAMGPPAEHRWGGIVCPGCFVELHQAATGLTCSWRLVPDTPFRHVDAPEYVRFIPGDPVDLDQLAPDEWVTANVDRHGWDVWKGPRS